jgi:hypothetical protein
MQLEVQVHSLPPPSEQIGLKNKNATDFTDFTDSNGLADDSLEPERPSAKVEHQRQPESRGGQVLQRLCAVFCDEAAACGFDF